MRIASAIIMISPFMAAGAALFFGAYDLPPTQILEVLRTMSSGTNTPEAAIILDIRLPRIILAGLAGMAGMAGMALSAPAAKSPACRWFCQGLLFRPFSPPCSPWSSLW